MSLRLGFGLGIGIVDVLFRVDFRGDESGVSSLISGFGEKAKLARFSLPLKLAGTFVGEEGSSDSSLNASIWWLEEPTFTI